MTGDLVASLPSRIYFGAVLDAAPVLVVSLDESGEY